MVIVFKKLIVTNDPLKLFPLGGKRKSLGKKFFLCLPPQVT